MPTLKLGRLRPRAGRLAALRPFAALAASLPPPPIAVSNGTEQGYAGMLGNDTAGDCTIAGLLGLMQNWAARNGRVLRFTAEQALAIYSRLSGYDPKTDAHDTGLVETDVLDLWVRLGFEGNRLAGYTALDPQDFTHLRQSIWLNGGVYLGMEMPNSAMEQFRAGEPWTVPTHSSVEGGHCVVAFDYDPEYLYVRTWDKRHLVAWDFVSRYMDVGYAPVDELWIGDGGTSPSGQTLAQLLGDLPALAADAG